MPENQPCPGRRLTSPCAARAQLWLARRRPPHRHPEPGSVPRILVVVGTAHAASPPAGAPRAHSHKVRLLISISTRPDKRKRDDLVHPVVLAGYELNRFHLIACASRNLQLTESDCGYGTKIWRWSCTRSATIVSSLLDPAIGSCRGRPDEECHSRIRAAFLTVPCADRCIAVPACLLKLGSGLELVRDFRCLAITDWLAGLRISAACARADVC